MDTDRDDAQDLGQESASHFFSGFVMLHWQRLVEVEPGKMFKFGYVLNVSYTT